MATRAGRGDRGGRGQPRQTSLSGGDRLADRYELRRWLGAGGMGEVWEAKDHHRQPHGADGRVAVKVLGAQHAGDRDYVQRFEREAKTLARLNHPNIVEVFGSGSGNGRHFLVMEFLDGRSGEKLIDESAPVDAAVAVAIVAQLCDALQYVHRKKIFHRDIKPGNVMVVGGPGEDGALVLKLMDFGIARAIGDTTITRHLQVLGTAPYLSPERLRGEKTETNASDIYSAGVLLYQLLTGALPYEADSIDELMIQQRHPPRPPHERRPGISKELSRAALCALAYEPDSRFDDAKTMGQALLAASKGEDVSGLMPTQLHKPGAAKTGATTIQPGAHARRERRFDFRKDEGGPPIDWGQLARAILVCGLGLIVIFLCVQMLDVIEALPPAGLVGLAIAIVVMIALAWTKEGRRQVSRLAGTLWLAVRPLGDEDAEGLQAAQRARANVRAATLRLARLLLVLALGAYWVLLTRHLAGEMQDAILRRPASEHLTLEIGFAALWILCGLGPLALILISRARIRRMLFAAFLLMVLWTVGAELLPKAPARVARELWPDHRVALGHRVAAEEKRWTSDLLRGSAARRARGASPSQLRREVSAAASTRIRALQNANSADARHQARRHAWHWLGRMQHASHKWHSRRCQRRQAQVRVVVAGWGAKVICG